MKWKRIFSVCSLLLFLRLWTWNTKGKAADEYSSCLNIVFSWCLNLLIDISHDITSQEEIQSKTLAKKEKGMYILNHWIIKEGMRRSVISLSFLLNRLQSSGYITLSLVQLHHHPFLTLRLRSVMSHKKVSPTFSLIWLSWFPCLSVNLHSSLPLFDWSALGVKEYTFDDEELKTNEKSVRKNICQILFSFLWRRDWIDDDNQVLSGSSQMTW